MDETKKPAKIISRKPKFNKETGEIYYATVYEFPRPPPKKSDIEKDEPP